MTAAGAVRAVAAPQPAQLDTAWSVVRSAGVPVTPLVAGPGGLLLKLDGLLPTGSFKLRGGLAAAAAASPGERLVTASAGNHGLGLAAAAARLGREVTVVVPRGASPAKVAALHALPAALVEHGDDFDAAEAHALALGGRYVSAYNDTAVITGTATVGRELLAQLPTDSAPPTVVVPVGGGGLLAGTVLALAGRARVVGVCAAQSPAFAVALAHGEDAPVTIGPTIADGLAGGLEPGTVTVPIARAHGVEVVAVTEAEVRAAMRALAAEPGVVAEGAGAVAVAAVLAGRLPACDGPVVALVTGRNVAPALLAEVLAP